MSLLPCTGHLPVAYYQLRRATCIASQISILVSHSTRQPAMELPLLHGIQATSLNRPLNSVRDLNGRFLFLLISLRLDFSSGSFVFITSVQSNFFYRLDYQRKKCFCFRIFYCFTLIRLVVKNEHMNTNEPHKSNHKNRQMDANDQESNKKPVNMNAGENWLTIYNLSKSLGCKYIKKKTKTRK